MKNGGLVRQAGANAETKQIREGRTVGIVAPPCNMSRSGLKNERHNLYDSQTEISDQDVAVIGMAGRFPGASSLEQFWQNLAEGRESITRLDNGESLSDTEPAGSKRYVAASSDVAGIDQFDAEFFGYSRHEAELMDPQARLFLECAWEAIEASGHSAGADNLSVGVYASQSLNTYLLRNLAATLDADDFILGTRNLQAVLANGHDFLSTRVSYKLDLRGPSIDLQCACSSSLVAIHMARQALLAGECDMALAGGVSIYLPQGEGYNFQDGMILSPDGHCRPFDAAAAGTVFGRGAGAVLLRPLGEALENGDVIRAVIKGSAVNNDGANKVGFTAPSTTGQAEVICEALADADVSPDTITYIEAHGTGTNQGDPIELDALTTAFRTDTSRTGYCAIGTVKSNFGHLDAAAGVAGFIKTVLTLEQGQIPPLLHYKEPNPQIDFENSPFYVNTELKEWQTGGMPRRAGVSSFGMGGTNAHVILEAAPPERVAATALQQNTNDNRVLAVSARNEESLHNLGQRFIDYLDEHPDTAIDDICYNANVCRRQFENRLAVVGTNHQELREALRFVLSDELDQAAPDSPKVVFFFTGQGSQYPEMGRELYDKEPAFRAALEECANILSDLDVPLLEVLFGKQSAKLSETVFTQPALFSLQYALGRLWRTWGIEPDVVLGHSVGEYAAACIAGVFTLPDGLHLIAERARLMQSLPAGGGMLAVQASEAIVREALKGSASSLSVAAINGTGNIVLSGQLDAIELFRNQMDAVGIEAQRLQVSHAFHSPLMNPMLDEFETFARNIQFRTPEIELISNVTAKNAESMDATYWRQHIEQPVRFHESVTELRQSRNLVGIEIGPHPVMLGMAREAMDAGDPSRSNLRALPSMRRGQAEHKLLLQSLGEAFAAGCDVNWSAVGQQGAHRRVSLPSYPFRRERFWIDPPLASSKATVAVAGRTATGVPSEHPLLGAGINSPLGIAQFETLVNFSSLPWLDDHRVGGVSVMPATAYIEIALTAARQLLDSESAAIESFELLEVMPLAPDSSRIVHSLFMEPEGGARQFQIFSAPESDEIDHWTLHARGVILKTEAATKTAVSLNIVEQIRRECEVSLLDEEFYTKLRVMGLKYGTMFRGAREVWCRDGEVVARVVRHTDAEDLPETIALDPGLFDSGLQIVFAATRSWSDQSGESPVLLPVRVERVQLFVKSLPPSFLSHARVTNTDDELPVIDITLLDDSGTVLGELQGLQLRPASRALLERALQNETDSWLHHVDWVPQGITENDNATTSIPNPDELAIVLDNNLAAASQSSGLPVYDELEPLLDALSSDYVLQALDKLGFGYEVGATFSTEELRETLGVDPKFSRMLSRMLEFLVDDRLLSRNGATWQVASRLPSIPAGEATAKSAKLLSRFPSCSAELKVLSRCGESLAETLAGSLDPMDLLFPGGSIQDLEALYTRAPFTRAYNELVRDAIAHIVHLVPEEIPLKILEVGAGTGGTSTWVLPELAGRQVDYVFTDLSPLFLARAQEKFAAYPFVSYEILDIGADLSTQSFADSNFDLILATNVLHATPDISATLTNVATLLKPDGSLIAVEGVRRQRWVDLIFGLTEGWWLFNDGELRDDYPLISRESWLDVLPGCGFDAGAAFPAPQERDLFAQAVIAARRSSQSPKMAGPARQSIVFADNGGVGDRLCALIESNGDQCISVQRGSQYELDLEARQGTVRPASKEDFAKLFQALGNKADNIVFLWSVDESLTTNASLQAMQTACEQSCRSALDLVRGIIAAKFERSARLWLVTAGAQLPGPLLAPAALASAPLWGFGRTVSFEHPELQCVKVDLDPFATDSAATLFNELRQEQPDDQVAYREGQRYVARLRPGPAGRTSRAERQESKLPSGQYNLESGSPGLIEELRFIGGERASPGPHEVEIEVHASGLNFMDLLIALDSCPGGPRPMGAECAGIVTAIGSATTRHRVGDRVMALAPQSFSRYVVASELLVAPIGGQSFEAAATIPAAFLTAFHALERAGGLQAEESILIHAASGGVGLAAVRLAHLAGARVLATAGSERKRKLLQSMGISEVYDSRSLDFVAGVNAATNSMGVDVVLNSLSGEFVDAGFSVLRQGGRFLELGKQGIWSEDKARSERPDATYKQYDVQALASQNPQDLASEFSALAEMLDRGEIAPLPRTVFAVDDVAAAFRFMFEARHVGKVVLHHGRDDDADAGNMVRSDATYLITGGMGALGLLVARWLVNNGARSLVLLGRSAPTDSAESLIEELRADGTRISIARVDSADQDAMTDVIQEIAQSGPPLRGVIHAAGTLDDGMLEKQNWNRFRKVFAAKVDGAWILHSLTRSLPLDFFVLFSSAAALLGFRGQANHAAANAFMDTLASHRRAIGLPATSINWGAWGEVGAVVERNLMSQLAARGLGSISTTGGIDIFARTLGAATPTLDYEPNVVVLPIDWPRFLSQFGASAPAFFEDLAEGDTSELEPVQAEQKESTQEHPVRAALAAAIPSQQADVLRSYLQERIAQKLKLENSQRVGSDRSLSELGLDSLLAVELRSVFAIDLGLKKTLPSTLLFDYPTLNAITEYIGTRVLGFHSDGEEDHSDEADQPSEDDLAMVSDEEAEQMLLNELGAASDSLEKGA